MLQSAFAARAACGDLVVPVSSAAANAGLTIMANAVRVGGHILERLGRPQPSHVLKE